MPKTPTRAGSAVRRPLDRAAVTATPAPRASLGGLAGRRLALCRARSPPAPEGLDLGPRALVDAAGARDDHAQKQEAAHDDALLLRRDVLERQRLAEAAEDRER